MYLIEKIKQAKKHIDSIVDYLNEDKNYVGELPDNAIGAQIEINRVLFEVEKHRWHDLRKNPDDLPERNENDESDYVLVLIGSPEWNHWEQAYYNHAKGAWSPYEQGIIAWKMIEPFESEVQG